jgi:hypothetical protein
VITVSVQSDHVAASTNQCAFTGIATQQLSPPHRTPQHHLAGHVDAVKLKDGLRQIDPDGGDRAACCMLVYGRRFLDDPFRQRPSWHTRCRVGAVHPITETVPKADSRCGYRG